MTSYTKGFDSSVAIFGRRYNPYRFAFNGKEKDDEINGWQDYGERMYNRLIGRFPTADPLIVKGKQYPELSPYQFASNSPIAGVDLDGLEYFYAGDGAFLGKVGTSTEVMLVDDKYIKQAPLVIKFANKYNATSEGFSGFANKFSRDVGMTNPELQMRAFLTLIRHSEKHSVDEPESYNQRNSPDANGNYSTSVDKNTPFGAYQLIGATFRSLLKEKNAKTNPENQDKAALKDIETFKSGKAYNLIISGDLSDPSKGKQTLKDISNILGTPTKAGGQDAQWPSLSGQSQEGLDLDQTQKVFQNAISNELKNKTAIETPKGKLLK